MSLLFKSHPQLILDRLNEVNGKNVEAEEVVFGPWRPNEDPEKPGDSAMLISAKPGSKKWKGEVDATYDRLSFLEVFESIGLYHLEISGRDITSTAQLVGALQKKYNWNITANDIIDEPIEVGENETVSFALKAHPTNSRIYKGSIDVEFTHDPNIPLEEVIVVTNLNGFEVA